MYTFIADEINFHTEAKSVGFSIYKTKEVTDETFKHICKYQAVDASTGFAINGFEVIATTFVKKLFDEYQIKVNSINRVESTKVKNASVYEIEYQLPNGDKFYSTTVSKSGIIPSSILCITNSIIASQITNGCQLCSFSEEGCMHCGFDKLSKIIRENNKNYNDTCKPFVELCKKELEHLNIYIKKYVEFARENKKQEGKFENYEPLGLEIDLNDFGINKDLDI